MLLAAALRNSHWELVNLPGGRLYSKVDPLTVLDIGGRYELGHRHLRQAVGLLPAETLRRLRAHLHRAETWKQDAAGQWRSAPPHMAREEAQAFDELWRVLRGQGWLRRIR